MAKELIGSIGPSTPTQPTVPPTSGVPKKTFLTNINGRDGDPGEDAYQIAVENGFEGTEIEWLESLDGVDGTDAYGMALLEGFIGTRAEWLASLHGDDGDSAYEIAVADGFVGTIEEWIASLDGNDAYQLALLEGFVGTRAEWLATLRGKSAYELAVISGFDGDVDAWLDFLHGADGKSAYQLAVDDGFEGDVELWLDSLEGLDGEDGYTPVLSSTSTHIQVQYVRDDDTSQLPINLIALSAITGPEGKSAYRLAVDNGFVGTIAEWIASLKGKDAVFPQTQGSAETVAYGSPAELNTSIDPETGKLLFRAKIPAGRDGTSPTQPVPSVVVRDAADGAPGSGTVSGTYPNWNFEFFIRRGIQGVMGPVGPSSPETNTYIRYGNGSPVGVISAPVGTTWTDLMQTNGAKEWFKASGTGNTGWEVSNGDTLWRNITAEIAAHSASGGPNGRTFSVNALVRRINNQVFWQFNGSTTGVVRWDIPSAFRATLASNAYIDGTGTNSLIIQNDAMLSWGALAVRSLKLPSLPVLSTAAPWHVGALPGVAFTN